jgi:MYXO-CTERM domain-containing protein
MSSVGCSQSGQTLTCTPGALALGSATTLTVVIQPGNSSASQLSFLAQSSGGEVDPADGTLSFALNTAGQVPDTDGPLPPWAFACLGLLLAAMATRRRSA